VWSNRDGKKIYRTFDNQAKAKGWRSDADVCDRETKHDRIAGHSCQCREQYDLDDPERVGTEFVPLPAAADDQIPHWQPNRAARDKVRPLCGAKSTTSPFTLIARVTASRLRAAWNAEATDPCSA
jgi:hypothetical protein